jgi:hypothetical protein
MQRLSDDLILTLITHPITKPTEKKVILPYPLLHLLEYPLWIIKFNSWTIRARALGPLGS